MLDKSNEIFQTKDSYNKLVADTLVQICDYYEKSAPTVSDWANDKYIHMNDVTLEEVSIIFNLVYPQFEHPNYAANKIYHLMVRQGKDTTGHAGF